MQLGPQILLAAGGQLLDPAELAAAGGGSTQGRRHGQMSENVPHARK